MSNPGPNPDFSPLPSDISLDLLPNELHTQMLLFLSPIQRLAVTRTQKLWRYLDASIKSRRGDSEQLREKNAEHKSEAIARELLASIAEGKKEVQALLMSLKEEIKTPDILNTWLWLALRLAAKQGHFKSMFLVLQEYTFNEQCTPLFEHIHAMTPFPFITEEQKRISENIDVMPKQDKAVELSLLLNNWGTIYYNCIGALQIFIENDQAQCMKSIFELIIHTAPLNKSLLLLMVNHNRFQCLNLFLQGYWYNFRSLEGGEQARVHMLKELITLATKKDYMESLQALLFLIENVYGMQGLRDMHEIASDVVNKNREQRWKCADLLEGIQFD